MSSIIAAAAIRGAHKIVDQAETKWHKAIQKWGGGKEIGFPNTAYFLPIIYATLGIKVQSLDDIQRVLSIARLKLPDIVKDIDPVPTFGPILEAGMATLFAEEIIEAIRYLETPDYYSKSEDPTSDHLWLGAADDVILRKRGVEFVDGTAPGFTAILGAAPDKTTAARIATELQEKNLYVFMCAESNGARLSQQLFDSAIQVGWPTRLVSFGPDHTAAIFALGFATRVALSFGGVTPGNATQLFEYSKNRILAFVLALGQVTDEWVANAAGALNFGFPVLADSDIPRIGDLIVPGVPYDKIVNRAMELRGIKANVTTVHLPVVYGPAFEGERVRGDDIYLESGGGRTMMVELVATLPMDQVIDGKVEVIGPEITDVPAGTKLPLAISVEVAGKQMQPDFEPILERQIHHLINYAQGVMHIGQRDIAWLRVSKQAVVKGFKLEHIGKILHARLHQDFGRIFDKLQVKIYSNEADVINLAIRAKIIYAVRDERIEGMTDESIDTFYSCLLCQSFAPSHVCVVSPERTGLCGSYNWMDCKASNEINASGPNQPIDKGDVIDARLGQWRGVNEYVFGTSSGKVDHYNLYSIVADPMTACGCMECIAAVLPLCNGVMSVNREYTGMTPSGMKFTTLAGTIGGGVTTPGFLGHSKYNLTQRKFVSAEGGIKRLVWMPKALKEEIKDRFNQRAREIGIPDLLERVADETVGTTEEDIISFLVEKNHPALGMEPLF